MILACLHGTLRKMAYFSVRMIIGLRMVKPVKVVAKSLRVLSCWQEITNFTQNVLPVILVEPSLEMERVTHWSRDPNYIVEVVTRDKCSRSTGQLIVPSQESHIALDWLKYLQIFLILKNREELN